VLGTRRKGGSSRYEEEGGSSGLVEDGVQFGGNS